jgi:hypothetical protein
MLNTNTLLMGSTIRANFKSIGNALYTAATKYWWFALIGALSGFSLNQAIVTADVIYLYLYWVFLACILCVTGAISCRHLHEFITGSTQSFPSLGKAIKFISFTFGLFIISVIGVLPLAGIGGAIIYYSGFGGAVTWILVYLVAATGSLYLFARIFLILPAIAVDNIQTTLKRSWQLTMGNAWKILVILYVATLAISFVTVIPEKLGGYLLGTDLLGQLIGGAITFWTFAISSVFYAEVLGRLFVFFHKPELYDNYL